MSSSLIMQSSTQSLPPDRFTHPEQCTFEGLPRISQGHKINSPP